MDEEIQRDLGLPPSPEKEGKSRKKGKSKKEDVELRPRPMRDLDADHKKFMAIMIGLFVVILLLMVFFNQYADFDLGGGI